jgi:hypothetical protein
VEIPGRHSRRGVHVVACARRRRLARKSSLCGSIAPLHEKRRESGPLLRSQCDETRTDRGPPRRTGAHSGQRNTEIAAS